MKKVLVIGANGFLGRNVANKCVNMGWVTDAVVNSSSDKVPSGVRTIYNSHELEKLKENEYDYIINTAAFIPYGQYNTPNEGFIISNINLPLSLHTLFPNSKIVFSSSISVYGNNIGVVNEKSDIISPTLYGLSKLTGELITKHHSAYAIVRFSSLYGSGMYTGSFIPRVVSDAKTKGKITLLGTGERKQNYLHISDAADYCIHAALYGQNEVYLGVSTHAYENREVAAIVSANVEGCEVIFNGEDTSPSFLYINEFTINSLNFSPKIRLEEGIKELTNA